MNETENNREIVKRALAGFPLGDSSGFEAILDPQVRYRIIGSTIFSGTFDGLEEFGAKVAGPLSSKLAEMKVLIDEVCADGERVFVTGRGASRTVDGEEYANDYCWVYRLRHGRIVEVTEYLDTEHVTNVFGRPEPGIANPTDPATMVG